MKTLTLLIAFLLAGFFSVYSGEKEDPCHYSTEGSDFWFGLMQNRSNYSGHYLEITVTSRTGADFTLRYGPSEIPIGSVYTVPANQSVKVLIDYNILEATGSEIIENKGIHLVSTSPVNVYALNYRLQSSDVAVIYPTESLGKAYFAMCYSPRNVGTTESNSQFLIVASEDNTTVTITPAMNTDQGRPARVPFSVNLNKGQSYQVQSSNSAIYGQGDLTGSSVTADKPVAFFSGSKATPIPVSGYSGYSYDHLYEQIPPVSTWGKEFYVVPLKLKIRDTYRVLAAENGTQVKIEATNTTVSLNKGEYYEFELTANQASRILSNRKILLAQYCRTQRADGNNGVGDPFMIILSSVAQKISDVTFEAYESARIENIFYVNIITASSETGSMILDGKNIGSEFRPFPDGAYSYAQVAISKGTHRLRNSADKGGFLAFVYGFGNSGDTESYGYGVGFNLDIQLDLGFSYVTNDTLVLCRGKEVKLEAESYFEKYLWNTGDTTSFLNVNKEGLYRITATTERGCVKSDSLYIQINDPEIRLGWDTSSCGPGKVILDAGPNFESYRWQDGSTGRNFVVNQTGDYHVTGKNIFGCEATDTIHVDVFQVPEVKIVGDSLNCGNFSAMLKVQISGADSVVWNYSGSARWSCSDPNLVISGEKPDGVNLVAKKPGEYLVEYVLTTRNKCQVKASFKTAFYEIPESGFEVVSPGPDEKCGSYERTIKYIGKSGSNAQFFWDFGGLVLLGNPSPGEYRVTMGANQRNRTISLYVVENGCVSPVTTKSVGVTPNFSFSADAVHGCDSLCVQFSSQVLIEDDVDYFWNFGDGAISDQANPLHCYSTTGKYDVTLLVVNKIDGCRNGSTEFGMINIFPTPEAKISADPEICYGDTVQFNYLNAAGNSQGKWFSEGNQILSDQNTRATFILTDEISKVGFQVEENQCISKLVQVQVKRKPRFDFETPQNSVCTPEEVFLKAIPKDSNLQFFWTLDSLHHVSGDNLNHRFQKPGKYTVSLEAVSGLTGCSAVLTKKSFFQVNPLPVPDFSQNFAIATLDHPEITFFNQSEGASRFVWNFGDGTTSEEMNPVHRYVELGDYRVVLEAYSEFGCLDTLSSRVKIIPFTFYVPNAFRPDSDLPENRVFLPVREGIDPAKYKFEVFNRLGSTVFSTTNPLHGWNGKIRNGTNAEGGIYVWVVQFNDIQGYPHNQKGTVMLLR